MTTGCLVGVRVGTRVGVLVGVLVGDRVGHACALHPCEVESAPHAFPPCAALRVTVRLLVRVPPPHALLHEPQPPQLDTAQCTAHLCVLHCLVSFVLAHELPPCAAAFVMLRARWLVPLPQVFVQLLHRAQLLTVQWIGHGVVLHTRDLERLGQATPPCAAWRVTGRDVLWVPPAQVLLQLPQLAQLPTKQFTGHGCVLHERVSDTAAHAVPPCAGCVRTVRERDFVPLPHTFEQLRQPPQLESAQSTGHGCVRHDADDVVDAHAVPPCCGAVVMVRCRRFVPPPHDLEHSP